MIEIKHHPDCIGHSDNRFGCPTQPTQEKEDDYCAKCEDCNPVSPKIKLVQKKVNIDPQIFKDLELHVNVKPTQDTESWMEEFNELARKINLREETVSGFDERGTVLNFILKMKEQWREEWENTPILKDSHMGRALETAHTQGAEAAVVFIEKNSVMERLNGTTWFSVREAILEEAKKV